MKREQTVLSLLLVVCLVVSLLPAKAVMAETEAGEEAAYSIDGGKTWTEASLSDAIRECSAVTDAQIRLQRNIILTRDNWTEETVLAGAGKKLTIDGRGHTVTRGDIMNMGRVNTRSSEVVLKDITIDGGAIWSGKDLATRANSGISVVGIGSLITITNNSTVTLEDGTILQNNELRGGGLYGAAVLVGSGSTTGGGTLVIKSGAQIRNNKVGGSDSNVPNGGAVYVWGNGSVHMEGGKLYNNYAWDGGAIAVGSEGTVIMSGGEIYENAAGNRGGAVFVGSNGIFTISGGSITGNNSDLGGGVYVWGGYCRVKGKPVIKDNTVGTDGKVENLRLQTSMWEDRAKIEITESLEVGTQIGITRDASGQLTSGWKRTMSDEANPEDYITSDNPAYGIYKNGEDGELYLGEHSWGDPVFRWQEDGSKCDAVFTCEGDESHESHKKEQEMAVTSQVTKPATYTDKGETTYHAEVTFVGAKYETTKVIADIPVLQKAPDADPTVGPTATPTVSPTAAPTVNPTAAPTASPTVNPTAVPTAGPTANPTVNPTVAPTAVPAVGPTAEPTVKPTANPKEKNSKNGKEDKKATKNKKTGSTDGSKPETGDTTPIELYATTAMIAGFTYLLLYFSSDKHGMTEEDKKRLVSRLIRWARTGGRIRRAFALVVIVLILVYYHSIGKRSAMRKIKLSLF